MYGTVRYSVKGIELAIEVSSRIEIFPSSNCTVAVCFNFVQVELALTAISQDLYLFHDILFVEADDTSTLSTM